VVRVTRALFMGSCWAVTVASAWGIGGCNSTSTAASYTPISGIEIQPSSLLQGLQCGTGANEVYRYVAVVWDEVDGGPYGPPKASNVFDCFTTGVFENLPASDGGSQEFFLQIFGFSKASLPAALTCPDELSVDGGVCPAQDTSLAAASTAPWTTTCSATQQQGIPVLAVCQPFTSLPMDGAASGE